MNLRFWKRDSVPRMTFDQWAQMAFANPLIEQDLKARGMSWEDGVKELDQDFQKILNLVGWIDDITSCIGVRSETARSVPVQLVTLDGNVVENPPKHIAKLLDEPNPDQGFDEFWDAAIWQYDLQGECPFVGLLPNGDYELSENADEFWVLRPAKMAPVYSNNNRAGREDRELLHWNLGDVDPERIPPEAVALAKRYHPNDAIRGLSPVKKLERKLRLILATLMSSESYYRNGAFPGVVVTAERDLDEDAKRAWKDQYQKNQTGARNYGKTLFLWGSGIKLERMRDAPKDSLSIETLKEGQRAVRAEYRTPPLMLAEVENANRSNSEAQELFFWRHSVMPLNKSLLHVLSKAIAPPGTMLKANYDEVEILQLYLREKAETIERLLKARVITRNEAREMLGKEQVEGLDDFASEPQPMPFPPAANGNGNGEEPETEDGEAEDVAAELMFPGIEIGVGR